MMIWMRHEPRVNETRAPLVPAGAAELIAKGWQVVVEDMAERCIPTMDYAQAGCEIVPAGAWVGAPDDAIILGLKELPDDGTLLHHHHIMFGHAYKGQDAGRILLDRFSAGDGVLLDLEALVDKNARRVAAFGYWAGFAGAALSVMAWGFQQRGLVMGPVSEFSSSKDMIKTVQKTIAGPATTLIAGALGRVGTGAADLCRAVGITPTLWDVAETAHGGPFPEIMDHNVFLNCILAQPGAPVFVPNGAGTAVRSLGVIGDIACDPDSPFTPIKINNRTTTWENPTVRTHNVPPLDVMAIDNLPSLLPRDSSEDFAAQLLPHLHVLDHLEDGVWGRAIGQFNAHV